MSAKLYVPEKDFSRLLNSDSDWHLHPQEDHARIIHSNSFRKLADKLQLFRGRDGHLSTSSVRNRLTHSLEVADIAARITKKVNESENFGDDPISVDVVYAAALAHDIGHPPFGHSGEFAMHDSLVKRSIELSHDRSIQDVLCFEGNAQTLRNIVRLENRISRKNPEAGLPEIRNSPKGLNLTNRTMLALLKYNKDISSSEIFDRKISGGDLSDTYYAPVKGYYVEEQDIVSSLLANCIKDYEDGEEIGATVECQLMDLADDIAYSTYDLEDCFSTGTLTPFDLLAANDDRIFDLVVGDVCNELRKKQYQYAVTSTDVRTVASYVFEEYSRLGKLLSHDETGDTSLVSKFALVVMGYATNKSQSMYREFRRKTSELLIESAVRAVSIDRNTDRPELSVVNLAVPELLQVIVLKSLVFQLVTMSSEMRLLDRRNRFKVETILDFFYYEGDEVLPHDVMLDLEFSPFSRERIISDYLARLTDTECEMMFDKIVLD